ncbi:hypothetical protein ACPPVO_18850 [Dactylosporangium sp. McL0621]|uniref:hypothetical protein n=1 Tax=Dactylosporangium sp. McL0621 TaxID=3415678 RepID=UPI003CF32536
MADDIDRRLDTAFADFTAAAAPRVKPAGLAPVRATVRRRRTVRIGVAAFVAAVAVIAPVAAFAARNTGTPPPPADSATPPPDPTGSPVPPDGVAPSLHSHKADCTSPSGDVRFLCDGTVTMPTSAHNGRCPDGAATFTGGRSGSVRLDSVAQTDVDGDGKAETIALYNCEGSDLGSQAVVAFTGTADGVRALGDFVTFQVQPGGIGWVPDIGTDADGHVWLEVSDRHEYTDPAVPQWRRYHWTGAGFAQDRGPTTFSTSSHGLVVTAALALAPAEPDGYRESVLTLTVRNDGTGTARDAVLDVYFEHGVPTGASVCPIVTQNTLLITRCTVGELAPGVTKTFPLHRRLTAIDAEAVTDGTVPEAGWAYLRFGPLRAATVAIPRATG